MTEQGGWISLHRKFKNWGWYSDPATKVVFIHILLSANWHDGEYLGYPVKRGEAVIGINALAKELGLTPKKVRTALSHLEKTGEITRKRTNRFSVVNICNFNVYQDPEYSEGQAEGKQRASKGQHPINKQDNNSKYNSILITEIVAYLNEVTGSNRRVTKATRDAIGTLLEQGYSAEDMKKVIDKKSADWMGTKYEAGLAPKSLFAVDRFDDYLNEAPAAQIDISAVQGELIHLKIKKNEDHLTQDEAIRLKELEEIYDKYRQKA